MTVNEDKTSQPAIKLLKSRWRNSALPCLSFLSIPFISLPSLSIEVDPLNPARGSEGCCTFRRGPWQTTSRSWNLVHLSLTIWHLVATMLIIFPENQLTKKYSVDHKDISRWWNDNFRWWNGNFRWSNAKHRWWNGVMAEFNHCSQPQILTSC